MMFHVKSCDTATWPEALGPLLSLLEKYQEKIEDISQASVLLGLGLGESLC